MSNYESMTDCHCAPGHCRHIGTAPSEPRIAKTYNRTPHPKR
ncbi:hypothetical protein [Saccharopolyspora erythraea]|nr:hypothetical protein [Saccharopolyspora erythraea]